MPLRDCIGAYHQYISATPRDRGRSDIFTPPEPASPDWSCELEILDFERRVDFECFNPAKPLACIRERNQPPQMTAIEQV
jgi:hypothetical protein